MGIIKKAIKVNKVSLITCFFFVIGLQIVPAFAVEKVAGHEVHEHFLAVKGFIEEVSHDNIKVLQKYYNIENALVKDKHGRVVSKGVLTRGSEVQIRLKNNVVTEVIFLHGYINE
jgi:hypothetical protein